MPYQQIDELPQDIKQQLPEHAQQIFFTAFNAAQDNGMSEEAARDVAWNSVKNEYQPGNGGQWQRKPEDPPIHNKAITTGGN